jgi:nitroimidazol reductase NimA-like FMN-containing flavoprotein (pyridoxamine 5'-phosphate oxidase superfamily)
MKRIITQIKNIERIEKELKNNYAGVIALQLDEERFMQIPTPYLYKDKNIYLFFTHNDEIYDEIQFDSNVAFTIVRDIKVNKNRKNDPSASYHFCATKISGIIRKVDDMKFMEELKKSYANKYSAKTDKRNLDFNIIDKVVVIDTEEINSIEEIGG